MARFICRLGTSGGELVVQEFEAASEPSLKVQLQDKGYYIFSIRPKNPLSGVGRAILTRKKAVSLRDFITFNQEFTALLKAGLPVLTALDLLLSRKGQGFFHQTLVQVRDDVQSGTSLSDAFKNRGDAFPPIYSATVAAGERSGELVEVIQRYLFYLRTVQTIRKKILSAMIYPIILLTLSVGLVFLLLTVIVPKFSVLFLGSGARLPALTEAVLAISKVFQYGWPAFLTVLVAIPVTYKIVTSRSEGRLLIDGWRLRLPVFGTNIKRYNIAQMCRTLGTLVAGGIPVVSALDVVADAMSNEVYKVELKQVRQRVLEGQALWASMEKTRMMTPMSVEMIEVGESTGSLAEMLDQVSTFYDEELGTAVERFVALLEPALLLVMAVIIALVVLSVYMPLFSMYNLMGN
jgi:type IV pilus assembly protein PilC